MSIVRAAKEEITTVGYDTLYKSRIDVDPFVEVLNALPSDVWEVKTSSGKSLVVSSNTSVYTKLGHSRVLTPILHLVKCITSYPKAILLSSGSITEDQIVSVEKYSPSSGDRFLYLTIPAFTHTACVQGFLVR